MQAHISSQRWRDDRNPCGDSRESHSPPPLLDRDPHILLTREVRWVHCFKRWRCLTLRENWYWCKMEKWDEVKWGEWHRPCDKVLVHSWSYYNISGRGSFALWDPESSSHDSVNDWTSGADVINGCGFQTGRRFHHAIQKSAQFRTYGLFISGIFI